jgi:hypothetical protein
MRGTQLVAPEPAPAELNRLPAAREAAAQAATWGPARRCNR